jgi:chromosome segregation ATPase
MDYQAIIPLAALLISVGTAILSFMRFGREVHVDDRREILRQLEACKNDCERVERQLKGAEDRLSQFERENTQYRRENYELLQELRDMRRRNGHTPTDGRKPS